MEDVAGWHGKSPNSEEMIKGLNQLGVADRIAVQQHLEKARQYQATVDRRLYDKIPKFNREYWWNSSLNMKVKMERNSSSPAGREFPQGLRNKTRK
jgi:transketolase